MVNAKDVEAELGETSSRDQPDIAGPDNSYFHDKPLYLLRNICPHHICRALA
jgi:hypothetical protein